VAAEAPRLIRTLSNRELRTLMARIDEHDSVEDHADDLEDWFVCKNRSLLLTRVDKLLNAYRSTFDERRQRRISFLVGEKKLKLPCTDLRWRKMTRGERDSEALDIIASADVLYFAIGLTRKFDGHYWPMVIGIHPIPTLVVEVNYDHL
jgi:hypothetical protein